MPKIATQILIVTVSVGMLVAGLWMLIWPEAAARWLSKFSDDSTPKQARWNARTTGAVLVLFGWAGLHLVLIQGLQPFDPGDNGVGF